MYKSPWPQDMTVPALGLEGMASPCKKYEPPRPKGTNCHRHTMTRATVSNSRAQVPQFLLSSVPGLEDMGDTLYAPYSTHIQLQVSNLCHSSLPLSQGQLAFGNGVCHHFGGTQVAIVKGWHAFFPALCLSGLGWHSGSGRICRQRSFEKGIGGSLRWPWKG